MTVRMGDLTLNHKIHWIRNSISTTHTTTHSANKSNKDFCELIDFWIGICVFGDFWPEHRWLFHHLIVEAARKHIYKMNIDLEREGTGVMGTLFQQIIVDMKVRTHTQPSHLLPVIAGGWLKLVSPTVILDRCHRYCIQLLQQHVCHISMKNLYKQCPFCWLAGWRTDWTESIQENPISN